MDRETVNTLCIYFPIILRMKIDFNFTSKPFAHKKSEHESATNKSQATASQLNSRQFNTNAYITMKFYSSLIKRIAQHTHWEKNSCCTIIICIFFSSVFVASDEAETIYMLFCACCNSRLLHVAMASMQKHKIHSHFTLPLSSIDFFPFRALYK